MVDGRYRMRCRILARNAHAKVSISSTLPTLLTRLPNLHSSNISQLHGSALRISIDLLSSCYWQTAQSGLDLKRPIVMQRWGLINRYICTSVLGFPDVLTHYRSLICLTSHVPAVVSAKYAVGGNGLIVAAASGRKAWYAFTRIP